MSNLEWSDRTSTGHSLNSYSGSLPDQNNILMVYETVMANKPIWRVIFTDGSHKKAPVEFHPTLEKAKTYAEECLAIEVSDRGRRSVAINAAWHVRPLLDKDASEDDIEALVSLAIEFYPSALRSDVRHFLEH